MKKLKIKDDFTAKYVLAYRKVGRSQAQFLKRASLITRSPKAVSPAHFLDPVWL